MSKTDKDRPLWVQNAEHGVIDHDHRHGECIISNDQRDRWSDWRTHRGRCNKWVTVHFECTKAEPYRGRGGHYYRRGWDEQTCWITVIECTCPIPDEWKHEPHGCDARRVRLGCIGHTRTEWDDSIPCSCDDKPEPATCFPAWKVGRAFRDGGVPSEFVRSVYHRPERARKRAGLYEARRRFNSGDDLEDFDFPNFQARNSARWLYW